VNFDHPDAIDSALLVRARPQALKAGEPIVSPRYDFARHARGSPAASTFRRAKPVILVEGILVFVWAELVAAARRQDLRRHPRWTCGWRGACGATSRTAGATSMASSDQYLRDRPARCTTTYVRALARDRADLVVPGEGDNQVIVRMLTLALIAMADGG
jgi:hypothetical protein